MKIVALIMGLILVLGSVAVAVDTPAPAGSAALAEVQEVPPYTGVIKNKTKYEVSIPSENSDATLVIPPHGWIEYVIWDKHVDLTAYHNGKPFYCLKIQAQPKNYQFMCSQYDFMAEIVKPEPVKRHWPSKLKRRKIKRHSDNPPC